MIDAVDGRGRERIALVLQGGGALGAYQAGVYRALDMAGYRPDWLAGISIGAINSALIAGGSPEGAVHRLESFWQTVTQSASPFPLAEEVMETAIQSTAAATTLLFGAPGFFTPRLLPPLAAVVGPAALSYYDTSELRATLERLVDFERLNAGSVRVSVGAVNIRSGNFVYFDTSKQRLGPEHIMASGALPPGLPPVEIDGEYYWDGGLVSNTPLQYVIDEDGRDDLLAFQVDLFSARGPMPRNMLEAAEREKDIRYSSRTRLNTDVVKRRQAIAAAAKRLAAKCDGALASDPDVEQLAALSCATATTIVHLIYKAKHFGSFSKDYEFSRTTMEAHWAAGEADVARTLAHPVWRERRRPDAGGVLTLDLSDPHADGGAGGGRRPVGQGSP